MPVVLQLTPTECGAACLAMICSFHGRRLALRDVRRILDPGRSGADAKTLIAAGRSLGLEARAYSAELDALGSIRLPTVLHCRYGHFVVLERWSAREAKIVDPSYGRRTVAHDDLSKDFSGVVLTFEPTARLMRVPRRRELRWRHFLSELRHHRGRIALVVVASVLLQISGLLIPIATALAVDRVILADDRALLPLLGGLAALLVLNQLVVSAVRERVLVLLRARLDVAFSTHFLQHLVSLPLGFFERRGTGDLLSRIAGNTAMQQTLSGPAIAAILDGGLLVVYVGIIFSQDVGFGLVTIALGLLQASASLLVTRQMNTALRSEVAARAATHNVVVRLLGGMATLKASGVERQALKTWAGLYESEVRQTTRVGRIYAANAAASAAMRLLVPGALLLYGTDRVISADMTLGVMLALIALATASLIPVSSLIATMLQVQRAGAHLDRLVDVLATDPEQDSAVPALQRDTVSGSVELRNVWFRFEAAGPWALENVSLTIRAGETIGIVGKSGSGKTTLAKVLLGLYPATSGQVLHDGRSVGEYDATRLRAQFGVVLQDAVIFGGTIREEIAFHDPQVTFPQVVEAAKVAALHDEIVDMALGYDTPSGEFGGFLAGGQLQRLALARAVARKPVLLVLDEATSHVDAITEEQITSNLADLSCTRIVIAHRLSSVRDTDRIIVVDAGSIVEEGTRDDLLALHGHYARLVNGQVHGTLPLLELQDG